jgi:hypothetical protein
LRGAEHQCDEIVNVRDRKTARLCARKRVARLAVQHGFDVADQYSEPVSLRRNGAHEQRIEVGDHSRERMGGNAQVEQVRIGLAIARCDIAAAGEPGLIGADDRLAFILAHDPCARDRDIDDEIVAIDLTSRAFGMDAGADRRGDTEAGQPPQCAAPVERTIRMRLDVVLEDRAAIDLAGEGEPVPLRQVIAGKAVDPVVAVIGCHA